MKEQAMSLRTGAAEKESEQCKERETEKEMWPGQGNPRDAGTGSATRAGESAPGEARNGGEEAAGGVCGCGCGHDEEAGGAAAISCGHDHGKKVNACGCGHDHGINADACGHNHRAEDACGYGRDCEAEAGSCGCGHDCAADALSCGCGHDHGHDHSGEDGGKKTLARFITGGALFVIGLVSGFSWAYLAAYAVFGWDVLWTAVKNIRRGEVFDENFLMSLATIGAIALNDLPEAVFVMAFYQLGEYFQDRAVDKSRRSIRALMAIRPDFARRTDGTTVDPETIAVGEEFVVQPGERVPLDGVVVSGEARLDTAAVTGEPVPRKIKTGDEAPSGCVVTDAVLTLRAVRPFGESTASRILRLTEEAAGRKSQTEALISRFAKVYTPAVVLGAVALAVLPPLLGGGDWSLWIGRALTFLVISCPCALVLSVPLTYFSGIGEASRNGVLVKGGNDLETLGKLSTLAFDKTGTLTEGVFEVTGVLPAEGVSREELLETAAAVESGSNHPIAQAVQKAAQTARKPERLTEKAGLGLEAVLDGQTLLAGNRRLLEGAGIPVPEAAQTGTVVYLAREGTYLGAILVSDRIRPDAAKALQALKAAGVRRMVMLSGDAPEAVGNVAKVLGISEWHGGLLPQDKVKILEGLLGSDAVGFAGDGINDAPALALADVGIAMGGVGSDAAMEAADVVIMQDDLTQLSVGVKIARKTGVIVRQNIGFALAVKAAVLTLGALGLVGLWAAVFADVGVALLAVLNAMRPKT